MLRRLFFWRKAKPVASDPEFLFDGSDAEGPRKAFPSVSLPDSIEIERSTWSGTRVETQSYELALR